LLPSAKQPLSIVPVGQPEGPLNGDDLVSLIEKLKSRCSFGVVDLPPVLSYPDALLLGDVVDGCLLVVEASRTPWHAAVRARDLVKGVGLEPLGVVLNKRRLPIPKPIYRRLP